MFYRRHRRVSLQTPHACVRVTSIPVAPPRAASIEPPELRRARRSRPLAIRVGGIRAHSRPRIGAPNASAAHAVSSRRARRSIARGRSRGNPRSAARSASPRQGGRSQPTRRTRNARNTRWYRPEVVWAFELVSAGSSRLPTEALLNVQAQKHDTRVFLAARSRSKGEVERRRTPLHE
jgi:hypothetical protein